jgi:MYXO-CTERM domain-containing protein
VRRILLTVPAFALLAGAGAAVAGPVPGSSCPLFPADNVWHADVSALPVHARSAAWLASASASTKRLHPDFGSSGDPSVPYGIPFSVVPSSHAKVTVAFDYADESDPGPYPLGSDTPIEGGAGSGGDMHTLTVDKDTCTLYETWYTQHTTSGWTAGSGATWSLTSNAQRPAGWTSADAAGLPILPGLLRPDEVAAGVVDHAIRFTVARTDRSYLWPARHQAGAVNDANVPPMGARFRLKASYDTSGFAASTRAVLTAMKKYGLLLADNGSDWFFQGSASNAWPDTLISELKNVPASAFEAVDESSLMVSADSMAVKTGPKRPTWTHWSPTTKPPASRAPTPAVARPVATARATPAATPAASRTSVPRAPASTRPVLLPEPDRETPIATNATSPPVRGTSSTRAWWLALPLLGVAVIFAVRRRRSV